MTRSTLAFCIGMFLLSRLAVGEVAFPVAAVTFAPEAGQTARIAITCTTPEKNLFLLVRDARGALVACLPTGPLAAGRSEVGWDGRDASGRLAGAGAYRVSLCRELAWQLDTSFGREGRIGRFAKEVTVTDPANTRVAVPGVLHEVRINGDKLYDSAYYRADEAWLAGRNYALNDGAVTLNPKGDFKQGDRVSIVYHYPVPLQNPWDLDVDSQGNLWVLSHWQIADVPYPVGRVWKLLPRGDKPDASFGNGGQISRFNASHQILVSETEKRLYLAGSVYDGYSTGVYALETGKLLYYVGGYFPNTPKTTGGYGICLGPGNKIYIRPLGSAVVVYDRTKATNGAGEDGFLYAGQPTGKESFYPPLIGAYWGPSFTPSSTDGTFYMAGWGDTLLKVRDTGADVATLYRVAIAAHDGLLGVCRDPGTNLLFAALRCARGEVAVIADDGSRLFEVARLRDPALGGLHAARWHQGYLYVLEDGATLPDGYIKAMSDRNLADLLQGRSRISRYAVAFGPETPVCTVTRE